MTITYLVDRYYDPADELGLAWDDPELPVVWPSAEPELSQRDRTNPLRAEIPPELRPR
jgi:dTDP-4-dehydrorhamnose 3,5-epimerase